MSRWQTTGLSQSFEDVGCDAVDGGNPAPVDTSR